MSGSLFFGHNLLTASFRYPYVTDLICNAGLASFKGIHWPSCIAQLFTEPINAVTAPRFYTQNQGEMSVDGLGWVWQCNMFAHYSLVRSSFVQFFRSISRVLNLSSALLSHHSRPHQPVVASFGLLRLKLHPLFTRATIGNLRKQSTLTKVQNTRLT